MERRRDGLLVLALLCWGCTAGVGDDLPRFVPAPPLPESGRIVDLTHPLSAGVPVLPGGEPYRAEPLASIEDDGYFARSICLGEHTGTHVDAPSYMRQGARSVADLDPGTLIGPAVVIDIRDKVQNGDPDVTVTPEDIQAFEAAHGPIPAGAIVVMLSGWDLYYDQPELYLNQDGLGDLHFPGFSVEAVQFLLSERDVCGLGVDTLSLDQGLNVDLDAHRLLLGAGKYAVENLTGLERLPASGATLIVAPLAPEDGSGAPARVLAVLPR